MPANKLMPANIVLGAPVALGAFSNGFPDTVAALRGLAGPALTRLLQAYELQANGSIVAKRQRLSEFIGVPT